MGSHGNAHFLCHCQRCRGHRERRLLLACLHVFLQPRHALPDSYPRSGWICGRCGRSRQTDHAGPYSTAHAVGKTEEQQRSLERYVAVAAALGYWLARGNLSLHVRQWTVD